VIEGGLNTGDDIGVMPLPLETTHLILLQHTPLSIRERTDTETGRPMGTFSVEVGVRRPAGPSTTWTPLKAPLSMPAASLSRSRVGGTRRLVPAGERRS
jgi:hypothetical protein